MPCFPGFIPVINEVQAGGVPETSIGTGQVLAEPVTANARVTDNGTSSLHVDTGVHNERNKDR